MCYCENTDRPGFAYSSVSESEPSFNIKCKQCKGDYQNYRSKEPCPACNGKGALLFLGKEDKILPTTGIIMSKGNGVAEPKYTTVGRSIQRESNKFRSHRFCLYYLQTDARLQRQLICQRRQLADRLQFES